MTAKPLFEETKVESIPQVEGIVKQIAEKFDLPQEQFGDILISVTEAVNNAMIHGNQRDTSKCVRMQIFQEEDTLAVHVTDEGKGFDHSSLPDPCAPENLRKLNGRGVFLIHQLCDQVEYKDKGRRVEMSFHLCKESGAL